VALVLRFSAVGNDEDVTTMSGASQRPYVLLSCAMSVDGYTLHIVADPPSPSTSNSDDTLIN
jgi:hypothetical protein